MGNHGINEGLVEGVLLRQLIGHQHTDIVHLLLAHHRWSLIGPINLLLDALEFADLLLLGGDNIARQLLDLWMFSVLLSYLRHRNRHQMVGHHHINKPLI